MFEGTTIFTLKNQVSLSRNYHDLSFLSSDNAKQMQTVLNRIMQALQTHSDFFIQNDMKFLSPKDKRNLLTKQLISEKLTENTATGTAFVRLDEKMSILANEEDHLRIQVEKDTVTQALKEALAMENALASEVAFAYDEQLGYLTASPYKVGTGLRCEQWLHLPGLRRQATIEKTANALRKKKYRLHPLFKREQGDLYKLENMRTLGQSEEEICAQLDALSFHIQELEIEARMAQEKNPTFTDSLWRAYALLCYSRCMSEVEFLNHWSYMRVAATMGIMPFTLAQIDTLYTLAVYDLSLNAQNNTNNILRANVIREYMRTLHAPL